MGSRAVTWGCALTPDALFELPRLLGLGLLVPHLEALHAAQVGRYVEAVHGELHRGHREGVLLGLVGEVAGDRKVEVLAAVPALAVCAVEPVGRHHRL